MFGHLTAASLLPDKPSLASASLPLCQRAQEEVHSKELKVKLLTDSVNSFIAKAPPTAHDALRSELDVLTANYQRLCSRLDGKCKTLEVRTWSVSFWSFCSVNKTTLACLGEGKMPLIFIRGCVCVCICVCMPEEKTPLHVVSRTRRWCPWTSTL